MHILKGINTCLYEIFKRKMESFLSEKNEEIIINSKNLISSLLKEEIQFSLHFKSIIMTLDMFVFHKIANEFRKRIVIIEKKECAKKVFRGKLLNRF